MAKRSAKETAIPIPASMTPGLVTSVITIMKAAYGAVPKALWGLNRPCDACIAEGTSREFTIDNLNSFKHYCRYLTTPGAYRIVSLRTAGGFNRKITILKTVRKVTFGSKFISEIVFPEGVTLEEIEFDEESAFNHPMNLPNSVRKLTLGNRFCCPLHLPQGLLELYLGTSFNRELALPDGIQVLKLGSDFCQDIHFPASLRQIELGRDFNYWSVVLPQGLQRITFRDNHGQNTHHLVLPDTLKYANIGYRVKIDSLPFGLEELVWHNTSAVSLPLSLKHLTLVECFNKPLDLSADLESIVFLDGDSYEHTLILPRCLKSITFNTLRRRRTALTLPDGCVRLY